MRHEPAHTSPGARHLLLWLFVALTGLAGTAFSQSQRDVAVVLQVQGAIGPASASYIEDGLNSAQEMGAEVIILKMDTPGGLDTSMRQIIRKILAAPVPVVTYVHPSGARAASAGTFILYASHVAAMTPGTNLGAATPVQIGAAPAAPGEEEEGAAPAQGAGERKAVNDAVAYIRSLAELRGRDADWGEEAVREAASLSADAALARGVVDIVARDMPTLLEDLDGRTVTVGGAERVLGTADIEIVDLDPDWTTRVLATITDPNVALILMMVGIYGLLFEFMNPGALVPGTIGAISLLIGLYALAALPVDFVGVALILLGIALMVAEAFAPSFGILGLGGIAAFAVGGAILIDTDVPEFQVDWAAIAALGVFSAALLVAIARLAIRSRRGRVHTGREELIGATGKVLDWENGTGHVFVHSERWNASGAASLKKGAPVVVQDVDGLRLRVSSIDDAEAGR
ncbi:MAG TPA: nodulation protein NfeD [Alteraurantiacibacter sp.]